MRRGLEWLKRIAIALGVIGALVLVEERARSFGFDVETRPAVDAKDPEALARAAEEILERAHEVAGFGGCALLAVEGEPFFQRCYGAGRDSAAPPLDSRFSIGSLWKAMVGLLVHEHARAGRLRLDDPISRHLPELESAPAGAATVAQLLAHTSGLPYTVRFWTNLKTQLSSNPKTDADYLDEVRGYALAFAPGTRFLYSNVGYGLLAVLLSRLERRPWRDQLSDLFAREGMEHTGFLDSGNAVAPGYLPFRCGLLAGGPCMLRMPRWSYAMLPGGGEYSTIADLLRWDRALARLAREDPALMSEYLTPGPFEGYASGWGRMDREIPGRGSVPFFGHSGEDPGYHTYLARFPENDATLIVLSNTDYTLAHAKIAVFDALIDAVVGREYQVLRR